MFSLSSHLPLIKALSLSLHVISHATWSSPHVGQRWLRYSDACGLSLKNLDTTGRYDFSTSTKTNIPKTRTSTETAIMPVQPKEEEAGSSEYHHLPHLLVTPSKHANDSFTQTSPTRSQRSPRTRTLPIIHSTPRWKTTTQPQAR